MANQPNKEEIIEYLKNSNLHNKEALIDCFVPAARIGGELRIKDANGSYFTGVLTDMGNEEIKMDCEAIPGEYVNFTIPLRDVRPLYQ